MVKQSNCKQKTEPISECKAEKNFVGDSVTLQATSHTAAFAIDVE